MIGASSKALADSLTDDEIAAGCLMPEVSRLWDVCGQVAIAVGKRAMSDGVATDIGEDALAKKIADYRWRPVYPEIIES